MKTQRNRRGHEERYWESRHMKVTDLREEAKGLENQHLSKGYPFYPIPLYPRPEFHLSHLKHDTDRDGLCGIRGDNGFKSPYKGSLVWWSLAVKPDDITSAERRLLETTYPDRMEEQVQMQQSFLGKFATSPSFSERSRLGSYRFTFPLEELLEAYSQQCCSGDQPIMRVYETVLYTQQVMYVILVHSPANQEQFSDRPLLTDDPNSVCSYKDGCFIWRPEAMCGTHSYELVLRPDEKQMQVREELDPSRHEFYVWDHVAVTLHVDRQVLEFDPVRLRQNLKYCEKAERSIAEFQDFPVAQELVRELWPDDSSPLERAEPLNKVSDVCQHEDEQKLQQ